MQRANSRRIILFTVIVSVAIGTIAGVSAGIPTDDRADSSSVGPITDEQSASHDENISVSCNSCHTYVETNTTRRKVPVQDPDHNFDLNHDDLWCLSCHATEDRNKLRLANGTTIPYENEQFISDNLCKQCHGPTYKKWQDQIHGTWNGSWENPTPKQSCIDCHNPHDPDFDKIEPEPAPNHAPSANVSKAILSPRYPIYAFLALAGALTLGIFAGWR